MKKYILILSFICLIGATKFEPGSLKYSDNYLDMSFMYSQVRPQEKTEFLQTDLPTTACTAEIKKLVDDNYDNEVDFVKLIEGSNKFTDSTFIGSQALDGDQYGFKYQRAETIMAYKGDQVKLFDGDLDAITASDIDQGALGDCYFLAAIAALSAYPQEIKDFFVNEKEDANGAYAVRLVIGGIPRLIIMDDFFPSTGYSFAYNHLNSANPDIWAMLLEKSWAKISGSYAAISGGVSNDPLHALTGAPSWGWQHNSQYGNGLSSDDLLEKMKFGFSQDYLFATGAPGTQDCGIPGGHAYTVQHLFENIVGSDGTTYTLLQIRNPWGTMNGEYWTGSFSFGSSLWTSSAKATVGYDKTAMRADGIFFMPYENYYVCFDATALTAQHPSYLYNFYEVSDKTSAKVKLEKTVQENWYVQVETIFGRIYEKADSCSESRSNGNLAVKVTCDNQIVGSASGSGFYYVITAQVGNVIGECYIEATVDTKDFYPMFVISVYSSEILHMSEDGDTCEDSTQTNGQKWSISGYQDSMDCSIWSRYVSNGDCSSYDSYASADGKTPSEACCLCGGGTTSSVSSDTKTGHYEYSKPTYFSTSQSDAEQQSATIQTPGVSSEIACDDQCDTCQTSSSNCQTCADLRSGPPTCGCESGTYEKSNGKCKACKPQCLECTKNAKKCTTCAENRDGIPHCNCQDGYYEDASLECQQCDQSCVACYSLYSCTSCVSDRTLTDGTCQCQSGYTETSSGECVKDADPEEEETEQETEEETADDDSNWVDNGDGSKSLSGTSEEGLFGDDGIFDIKDWSITKRGSAKEGSFNINAEVSYDLENGDGSTSSTNFFDQEQEFFGKHDGEGHHDGEHDGEGKHHCRGKDCKHGRKHPRPHGRHRRGGKGGKHIDEETLEQPEFLMMQQQAKKFL